MPASRLFCGQELDEYLVDNFARLKNLAVPKVRPTEFHLATEILGLVKSIAQI